MKPVEKLELVTQALVLQLGMLLTGKPSTEQIDAMVERIVAAIGDHAGVRKILGIGQRIDARRQRMRVSAVAYTAWQTLRLNIHKTSIGDLAAAISDPRLTPVEGLVRSRHEIGLMIQGKVLAGGAEQCDRPVFTHTICPVRTLIFLSGGAESLGFLTYARAARLSRSDDDQGEEASTQGAKPVPTARQLYEQVRHLIINCDQQLKTICSRVSLASCRADMLARGIRDEGVGNQVLVIFGKTGTGKTYAVEEVARASNMIFSCQDGSSLSGTGWAGAAAEDVLKQALALAGGNSKRASRSICCWDEIDKVLKAGVSEHRFSAQADLLRPLGGNTVSICGKRNFDGPPTSFDCAPTCFILSGVFEGLSDLAKRRARQGIGFQASVVGEKVHTDFRHALHEYGVIEELCGRVSAFVRMTDFTVASVVQALVSEHGIIRGFNQVLGERGIVLSHLDSGVNLIANHVVKETGTGYRGAKHLIGSIAEELLFDGEPGTVKLDANLVRRAIDRASAIDQSDAQNLDGGTEPILVGETDVQQELAVGG